MAALIQAFDASKVNPEQGSSALPIGKHPVIVESSEVKPNKNNDGGYLQLNLRITDGPQAGASGAYRLNLYHSNPQTVEIAHKQLSAVCHVTGVFMLQDSVQLHNIPFIIEVGPQKNDPQYTEVKKVFDAHGNEPGKQNGAPAAQPQQPAMQQQSNPVGGFGSQAPAQQGAPWSAPQGQQAAPQQPQGNAPAWGQQQPQQPAQQPAAAPAWGNQQPAQQQAPQQPAAAGWQQNGGGAGGAPWSAPR